MWILVVSPPLERPEPNPLLAAVLSGGCLLTSAHESRAETDIIEGLLPDASLQSTREALVNSVDRMPVFVAEVALRAVAEVMALEFLDDLAYSGVPSLTRKHHGFERVQVIGKLVGRHRHGATTA